MEDSTTKTVDYFSLNLFLGFQMYDKINDINLITKIGRLREGAI